MMSSKEPSIIPAEDVTGFNRWQPPEMTGNLVNADQIDARNKPARSSSVNTTVTAQSLEQIRDAAYQEGLSKGHAEGKAEVKQEQQHITDSLNKLLNQCHKITGNYDQQIAEQIVSLTIAIAKQVIRRELNTDPEQIMAVVRDAINCLPSSTEKLILKLHPDDASLVREIYHLDEEPERTWKVFEDPNMQRGGCVINTESSVVNADLETRIAVIVNQLMGGERSDD